MLVPLPTDHPFAGIAVKLQRADENIANLGNEIFRFFQECKYPVIPEPKNERWQDAVKYHQTLTIPKRFGVLAGEIIHHFRSCLDHIVWIFSDPAYRQAPGNENSIQFPILVKPPNANDLKRFERQVGGIANPSIVRQLISDFQPYKLGADAIDHPLCIIHDMDRFDKHRELVIVQGTGNLVFPPDTPPEIVAAASAHREGKPISINERWAVVKALNDQVIVLPQVAFAKIGKREGEFLVPSLQQLASVIEKVVAAFMGAL